MRLYYEIGLRSFRRAAVYRGSMIWGMITNAFFGALRCYVFIALYRDAGSVAGFTLQDAISYTWITQSLISIGAGWISTDISTTIRTGDVVSDLSRPWSFYGYWLSRFVGERVFNLLVRGTLTYMVGVVAFGAHIPTPQQALGFALAICLAIVCSFGYSFLCELTTFWLMDPTGVWMFASGVLGLFSGFLVPLAFFPPPLRALADVLPFRAITAIPAEIFLGKISGAELPAALLLQLFWCVVLVACGVLLQRAAMYKVVVQGG